MPSESSGEELNSAQLSVDSSKARVGASQSWWQTFFEVSGIGWGHSDVLIQLSARLLKGPRGLQPVLVANLF